MNHKDIISHVDHTLLKQDATSAQIRQLCEEAIAAGAASVCIPPAFVAEAKAFCGEKMQVCTVIGFPEGYMTTAAKVFETADAVENDADEIDMVIHVGMAKEKKWDDILREINAVKKACGDKILKVIVETCLLNEEEKITLCEVVSDSDADYIKTSTGFAKGGATFEDVALFAKHVSGGTKIKAAGGIRTFEDADRYLELGADRIGSSGLVTAYLAER